MAHHKSAKIRIRRNARRAVINRDRVGRVRTYIKKVEAAIAAGKKGEAMAAFKEAQPVVQRGVTKGVVKAGTASRKLSRLSARIKALQA
jgi:small subunit ribosomal protein S20